MTEPRSAQPGLKSAAVAREGRTAVRASSFKYYIHDGVEACRLQLVGEFTEREVAELDGCWRTTKTTLGKRRLVLDLRGVTNVDEAGKRWLASMASEGAHHVPESFLQKCISGMPIAGQEPAAAKVGIFGRLLASLRGARVDAAQS
jgi:ABC-type transporter Mla MlaB component